MALRDAYYVVLLTQQVAGPVNTGNQTAAIMSLLNDGSATEKAMDSENVEGQRAVFQSRSTYLKTS